MSGIKVGGGRNHRLLAFVLVAMVALASLAISAQSLWIDEAHAATKALQSSLFDWWHAFSAEGGSDIQMPLYMFLLWGWEKLVGQSEIALRAFNLPWLLIALWSWLIPRKRSTTEIAFLLVGTAANCFVWQYMDEARPYVMQLAGACLVFNSAWALAEEGAERASLKTRVAFWAGIVVLAGSSMLGVFWAGSAMATLAGYWLAQKQWNDARAIFLNLRAAVILWLPLIVLGAFYAWTLTLGAGASTVSNTGLASILFAVYELCGFMGLGPSRHSIRDGGLGSITPYLPGLVVFGGLFTAMIFAAKKRVLADRKLWVFCGILALSPIAILIFLALIKNFRVLGRHLTPVEPMIIAVVACGATQLWHSRGGLKKGAAVLFFAAALFSCAAFRLSPRHGKDDYRSAAHAAKTAVEQQRKVWWAADFEGAHYYDLLESGPQPKSQGAWFLFPFLPENLDTLPSPDLIFLSRPDVFDNGGRIRSYAEQHGFQTAQLFTGFVVFSRSQGAGAPKQN